MRPHPLVLVMASNERQRCVFQTDSATVEINNQKLPECAVQLTSTEIRFLQDGNTNKTLQLSQIRSIQVYQPIFGANYITGEYINQGSKCSFTITFNKGGATEFARAFFRITEGKLVTTTETTPPSNPDPIPQTSENKKNV